MGITCRIIFCRRESVYFDSTCPRVLIRYRLKTRIAVLIGGAGIIQPVSNLLAGFRLLVAGWRMRTAVKEAMILSGTPPTFGQVMSALLLPVWLRETETSGTTVINYGTAGATLNGTWTPGAGAQGQTDALGPNEAYLFDGLNSLITLPSNALINGLQAATYIYLVRATSAGEGSSARLYDTNTDTDGIHINSASLDLRCTFAGTGAVTTVTNTGFLSLAVNTVLFVTYAFSGDFKARFYKSETGVVSEATYASQTAGSGTKTAEPFTKAFGNRLGQSRTWAGLIGEIAIADYVLSLDQMTAIAQAVARGIP